MNTNYFWILTLVCGIAFGKLNAIEISGVQRQVDTLVYRQIAPGTMYTHMQLPEYPLQVFMLTIDMENAYNTVETFQAYDQVGKTEAMTNAFDRLRSTALTPIGSVNGNFWIVSGQGQPGELLGVPHSGSIRNGEMVTDPNEWNRGHGAIGFAAIDVDKRVWIDDMTFAGQAIIEGVGEYPISEVNRIRQTDELVFFNSYAGGASRSDNNGIEVFIKPVSGQAWGINQYVVCEVTRIVKDSGQNAIQEGESVLSGNGKAREFLENNLEPGKLITLNMGIALSSESYQPYIQQMITGNALVMKNGILTDRNTNEAYNSQLYPRTGIGMSEDGRTLFMIVIDKSGRYIGANTATMCEILKAAGAWNVTGMDGGGSAQMMLQGRIVNNPSDGKERAVANGWMLFSSAPEDAGITSFDFADYSITIPAYADYIPAFLGYNQYGVLCTEHLEGVTLSCDPAVGKVVDGTTLVASSVAGEGYLIAKYNDIEIKKWVKIEEAAIGFRLSSVILDKSARYVVEVESRTDKHTFYINPASLSWEIEDETICRIENGVLFPLANGETWLKGTLGEFSDRLKVSVEIPSETPLSFGYFSSSDWQISTNLPTGALIKEEDKVGILAYTYASARLPFIQLENKIELYSIPKAIKFIIDPKDTPITSILVNLRFNNESSNRLLTFDDLVPDQDNELILLMADLLENPEDPVHYPVSFESIRFSLTASANVAGNAYQILLKDFQLVYSEESVHIQSYQSFHPVSSLYPNPVVDGILYGILPDNDISYQKLYIQVYSLSGIKIKEMVVDTDGSDTFSIPLAGLAQGGYVVKVLVGEQECSYKIMIQ